MSEDLGAEWASYPTANTGEGGSSSLIWSGKLVDTGGQGDDGTGYVAAVPVTRNAAGQPVLTITTPPSSPPSSPPLVTAETKAPTPWWAWALVAAGVAKLAGVL